MSSGAFVNAGAGVKTNLLFFTRGKQTEKVWDVKVGKRTPLTAAHFDEFFKLLSKRADSERSWTVTRAEIEKRGYDLKAVNPNRKVIVDPCTPCEILDLIEVKSREIFALLATLKNGKKE